MRVALGLGLRHRLGNQPPVNRLAGATECRVAAAGVAELWHRLQCPAALAGEASPWREHAVIAEVAVRPFDVCAGGGRRGRFRNRVCNRVCIRHPQRVRGDTGCFQRVAESFEVLVPLNLGRALVALAERNLATCEPAEVGQHMGEPLAGVTFGTAPVLPCFLAGEAQPVHLVREKLACLLDKRDHRLGLRRSSRLDVSQRLLHAGAAGLHEVHQRERLRRLRCSRLRLGNGGVQFTAVEIHVFPRQPGLGGAGPHGLCHARVADLVPPLGDGLLFGLELGAFGGGLDHACPHGRHRGRIAGRMGRNVDLRPHVRQPRLAHRRKVCLVPVGKPQDRRLGLLQHRQLGMTGRGGGAVGCKLVEPAAKLEAARVSGGLDVAEAGGRRQLVGRGRRDLGSRSGLGGGRKGAVGGRAGRGGERAAGFQQAHLPAFASVGQVWRHGIYEAAEVRLGLQAACVPRRLGQRQQVRGCAGLGRLARLDLLP